MEDKIKPANEKQKIDYNKLREDMKQVMNNMIDIERKGRGGVLVETTENAKILRDKKITKYGTGACIIIPKEFLNKEKYDQEAVVIVDKIKEEKAKEEEESKD